MFIDVNKFLNLSCDSDMIQAALDEAVLNGYSVVIPKRNMRTGKDVWDITKTIFLYDESIVILQNAHIRIGDGAVCNIFSNKNARISGCVQRNITIKGIGKAVLDGGIHNGIYETNGIVRKVSKNTGHHVSENCTMYFRNVENLVIENICIKNQRYWGICLYSVAYSRFSNIDFSSESNVPNQDGLDILAGCHDIIAENITGCTGDNLIAIVAIKMTDDGKADFNGDIYNISVRNVLGYGVGGCALIRLLNHDGYKIYNVRIDNVIETSPWSEKDANIAQNPDLVIKTDEDGNVIPWKRLVPGEKGYRVEAAIIIGESYWFSESRAKHGDTFGISVSNVFTHARFGLWLNHTLLDSSFENIRMFGNGFVAVFFGEGRMENLRFDNVLYDADCKPHDEDKHIRIEWNNTESKGLSAVYFNGTVLENVEFGRMRCSGNLESVFGGHGDGCVIIKETNPGVVYGDAEGIEILQDVIF